MVRAPVAALAAALVMLAVVPVAVPFALRVAHGDTGESLGDVKEVKAVDPSVWTGGRTLLLRNTSEATLDVS